MSCIQFSLPLVRRSMFFLRYSQWLQYVWTAAASARIKINFRIVPIISILSISGGLFSTHKYISRMCVCKCTFDILFSFRSLFFCSFTSRNHIAWPTGQFFHCILLSFIVRSGGFQVQNKRRNAINIITWKWAFINRNNKPLLWGEYIIDFTYRQTICTWFDQIVRHVWSEVIAYWHYFSIFLLFPHQHFAMINVWMNYGLFDVCH